MQVEHSGWSKEKGWFSHEIFIDENKTDYEILFADGFVSKQLSPFQEETHDWNCDGDIYTRVGAWFSSRFGSNDFWTPEQMVRVYIDSMEDSRLPKQYRIVDISGVDFSNLQEKESLSNMIFRAEKSCDNLLINERNFEKNR